MSTPMGTQAHLTALETKHSEIEHLIDGELHRPAPDQSRLTDLKRKKLKLKEEIDRLKH